MNLMETLMVNVRMKNPPNPFPAMNLAQTFGEKIQLNHENHYGATSNNIGNSKNTQNHSIFRN